MVRHAPAARRLLQQKAAQATLRRQPDEGPLQQLREGQRLHAGMDTHTPARGRQQRDQVVGQPGLHHQAAAVHMVGHDAQVGHAAAQRVEHGIAGQLLQVEVDVRVLDQKAAQPRRQGLSQRGGVAQQAHRAAQTVADCRHLHMQRVQLGQHALRLACQRAAGVGGGRAGLGALQQRRADAMLQRLQPRAGRSQRQVHRLRSGGDAAVLQHRGKQPQIEGVDAVVERAARSGHGLSFGFGEG